MIALFAYPSETETETSVNTLDENVTPSDNQVCVPNEVKMEDCNRCKCAPNGVGWFCTRKACPVPVSTETKEVAPAEQTQESPSMECVPGTTFKRECNTCTCTSTGLAACPRKNCVQRPIEEGHIVEKRSSPALECEPGTTFKRDCNNCQCTSSGKAVCTKKKCVHFTDQTKPVAKRSAGECEPGTTFKKDCNNCHCTDTGLAICTKKKCKNVKDLPKPVSKRSTGECEPGTTFKKDCNNCHCTDTGLAICTKKKCINVKDLPKPVSKRSVGEKECEPGTTFKRDCNDCHCTETGLAVCTKMGCVNFLPPTETTEELPAPEKECEPGTRFKQDCNSCICTETGFAVCTQMGCLSNDQVKNFNTEVVDKNQIAKRSPRTAKGKCTPGQTVLADDGCNTCFCNADGSIGGCTFKLCVNRQVRSAADNFNDPTAPNFSCTPGASFKHADGCNDCRCSENGKHAACTLKLCPGTFDKPRRDPYAPDFQCTPGSTFVNPADGCNMCTCKEDGTTAECTQTACADEHHKVKRSPVNNDPASPDFSCQPGTSFKHADGCNDCTCAANGKLAICTLKLCPGTFDKPRRDPYAPDFHCTPGSTFVNPADGCNMCTCKEDGTTAGCTQTACADEHHKVKRSPVNNDPASPDFSCQPGTSFKHADGCNDCTCAANGKLAICTLKLCPGTFDKPRRDPYAPDFHCTPGSTFVNPADGCNMCTCKEDGTTAGCTEMACADEHHKVKRSPVNNDPASPDFSCVPGTSFKHADGCNDCTCSDNGKFAACTLKLCVEPLFTGSPYEDGFSCKPEASFRYECNDCRCLPNGKAAMCTFKLCNPDSVRTVRAITNQNNPNQPNFRCTPGEQFTHSDGCNSCICNQDGKHAACTLKMCITATSPIPETVATVVPPQEKKCVPGSHFPSDDGCNTCFCTNEGKVGCTLMYCENRPLQPSYGGLPPTSGNKPKAEQPIQFPVEKPRYKRDDNDDLYSLPHFDTSAPGFRCEPNLRFRDKCNACFCNAQGLAACTDALCPE
uniref:CSON010969 protein n=1 Tax=Culicoides sonorensis TaxID=179676 RepID=A0A336LYS6_CULSO